MMMMMMMMMMDFSWYGRDFKIMDFCWWRLDFVFLDYVDAFFLAHKKNELGYTNSVVKTEVRWECHTPNLLERGKVFSQLC